MHLAEAGVGECTGQRTVVGHPGHIQVLDADKVEACGELVRELMVRRLAGRCNPTMQQRALLFELGTVLGGLLTARQTTIEFLQPFELGGERTRVRDMAVLIGETRDRPGQRGEVGEAGVDTNLTTDPGPWPLHWSLRKLVSDHERGLPPATGVRDRDLLDRGPTVLDEPVQASCGLDGVQPHELLGTPTGVRVLRLDQRLWEHQADGVPRVVQP